MKALKSLTNLVVYIWRIIKNGRSKITYKKN